MISIQTAFPCLKEVRDGVQIAVKAVVRSSKSEIVDIFADHCRIKVKAPPVDGEANEALIRLLSETFRIPRRDVALVGGATGRKKCFLLRGIAIGAAVEILKGVLSRP